MISRNALAKCAQQAMKFQHAKTLAFGYSSSKLSSFSDRLEPQQANKLTDIGIRKIFEHEHDMYRETCRKFYDEEVKPYHDQWEEDGNVSREVWKKAGEQGMLCVSAPEKYGGLELDCLYAAVHWEEQAYSNCLGPGFFLHNEIAFPYFLHYGSEEQKQRYLPAMIKGDIITAIAMTEPGAGSDLQGMRTNAVKDGDYYIINGSKTYITNGWMSDVVIVCVKTDLTVKGSRGISLFLIDADTPGFKKGKKLKKMGMKAQDTSELFFEDVRVHKSTLLGQENKGFTYLMSELPQERLQVGIMALSSAEACFEWTRTFVKERKAFGGYLSDLQVIRHKLAEMKTEICIARSFADNCIKLHQARKLDNATASMCKYYFTDLQTKIADQCVQLHGGAGYMMEYPVAKAYVDGRVSRIYAGANEIMKELISRGI